MKKNMGMIDRVIRILIAATIIVLFATKVISGTWGGILLAFSGIFILTSIFSLCPLYLPFKFATKKE